MVRFYGLDGRIIGAGEPMKSGMERFSAAGMTMEEIARWMEAPAEDLEKLLHN